MNRRLAQTQSALMELTYWLKLISTGKPRARRSLPRRVTRDLNEITHLKLLSVLKTWHMLSLLIPSNHIPYNDRHDDLPACMCVACKTSWLANPRNLPFSTSSVQRLQLHAKTSSFLLGYWDPNPRPHATH